MDKKIDALTKYQEQLETLKAGTVTAIKSQRDPGRCSIHIDGEFRFGVSLSILEKSPLFVGSELTIEQQESLLVEDFKYKARALAFNYLSFRSRSRKELTARLNRYSGKASFVDEIVNEMVELGYIDDGEFATRFVESRHRLKGHGPGRLRSDLIRKGIGRPEIDAALAQISVDSLNTRAEKILRSKWQNLEKMDRQKRRNRALGLLLRRGYAYHVASEVLSKLENESPGDA